MANTFDFNALLERVIAVCLEAVGGEGKPFWLYSQEAFPFFVARVLPITFAADPEDAEDIDGYEFTLAVRHITGNRTEGLASQGEPETKLYEQMPLVIEALLSRDLMQSFENDDAMQWLEDAQLTSCSGLSVYDAAGIGGVGLQIGTEYILTCVARLFNEQTYE